ncbi:oligosaccharide flippase family protein [Streptococcus uberis]
MRIVKNGGAEIVSKYGKLVKNVLLITLGNFGSKILSFLLIPLYTAVLTTAEYGIADLLTTTVNLLLPFFTLIISESVMRFALDQEKNKKEVFSIGIYITIIGFLILVCFTPFILTRENIRAYYVYFLVYYLAVALYSVLSQFARGIEKVAIFSLCGVLQTLVFISLNILFLFVFKIGLMGYLLSLILSTFFADVFLWFGAHLSKYVLSPRNISKETFKEMLGYSVPMIPNSISWWISNSSDKYIITFFSGVALTGVYSVSQRIPSLFSIISTIFMGAWQISAVEDFGTEESRHFFSNVYRKYSELNILIISLLICGTRILAHFLFSNDFYQGWIYVPVLLFASMFYSMGGFLGTIYTSAKKTKMLFISTVIAALANIVFNYLLIPKFGAMGAAIATLISYFMVWVIRIVDTSKILKLDVNWKKEIILYILVFLQIVLMLINTMTMWGASVLILLIILVTMYKDIIQFMNVGIKYLSNVIKKR